MNRSENNIEQILGSLDGMSQAEARPFMYTRVMARMQGEEKTIWGRAVSFIARPAIAMACVFAVIATNLYFVTQTEEVETEATSISNTSAVEDYWKNDDFLMTVNNIEINE